MAPNILSLMYLYFRLSPFIIACFFSLSSIFDFSLKGFLYLIGLIFACFLNIVIGNIIGNSPESTPVICHLFSIQENSNFSNFPLSGAILSYTFFYLLYAIITYNVELFNLPTLIIFPILILSDIGWNITNGCTDFINYIGSIIIGGGFGALWAFTVNKINAEYLYLSVGTNRTACARPSEQKFKCTLTPT